MDLRSSLATEALDFRQRFPDIQIVEPIDFLREIRRELLSDPPAPKPREPGLAR